MTAESIDVFISHSWRYHDDWIELANHFDDYKKTFIRNFSLPWHDPAIEIHNEKGRELVKKWLEKQVIPAKKFFLLSSVTNIKSALYWIDYEIEVAKKHSIPIIGLPLKNSDEYTDYVRNFANKLIMWDDLENMEEL